MPFTDPQFKQVVIVLSGKGGDGKSTLAASMLSDHVHHIPIDHAIATLSSWTDNTKLCGIHKKYPKPNLRIDAISRDIEKSAANEFATEFISKYMLDSITSPVILLEGYTLGLSVIRAAVIAKLHEKKYRI